MKYWCLRRKYLFIFFCFDTCLIFFLKISKLDCFFLIYITCALIHKRYNKNLSVVWIYVRTFSTYWLNSHASHSHATRLRTCIQWKKAKKKKKIFRSAGPLEARGPVQSHTSHTPKSGPAHMALSLSLSIQDIIIIIIMMVNNRNYHYHHHQHHL